MEAPEYLAGGCYRDGNSQFIPEKNGKDHFIVEELLDFSNEDDADNGGVLGSGGADEDAGFESAAGNSTDSSTVTAVDSCNSSLSGCDQHLSGENLNNAGDLWEPYDELAELEWLSNFVEESFSSEDLQKLQLISGVQSSTSSAEATRVPVQSSESKVTDQYPTATSSLFLPEASSVPAKARSKRSRAARCNWSSRLLVRSPSAAAAATATSSSSDSDAAMLLSLPNKSPKTSKKREPGNVGPTLAPSDGRRCLHCATDKTPQWRTGPMGPKTLCNACGVRYKSGRLVPEYRPASSPTFVLSKHSNSHRKVLELRRQKETHQSSLQSHPLLHIGNLAYDGVSVALSEEDFLIHHHLGPDIRQLI